MGQIIYPNFSDWARRMVQTASGVLFAPQDFTIDYETGRRCYFDWYEALGFEEKVLRPNGWRLPTASELEEVAEHGYEFVFRELNLGLYGYIPNNEMTDYRRFFLLPVPGTSSIPARVATPGLRLATLARPLSPSVLAAAVLLKTIQPSVPI